MSPEEALEVYQPAVTLQAQVPKEVLRDATIAAKALNDVISKKAKKVVFGGEQYLEIEDWEMLGKFYGLALKTHDPEPVEVFGVQGFKAKATITDVNRNILVGSAEAYCMRDEENWGDRKGKMVPMFQLASMAQTRAGAKAFRNLLSWVAVLAGYRPTPAEEMREGFDTPTRRYNSSESKGKSQGFDERIISDAQRNRMYAMCKENNVPKEMIKEHLENYRYKSSKEIKIGHYDAICSWIENYGSNPEYSEGSGPDPMNELPI